MNDHEPRAVKVEDREKQLHALHEEFRTTAYRLYVVANWIEHTQGPETDSARAARNYANAAKEVLDKGLIWLVEQRGY